MLASVYSYRVVCVENGLSQIQSHFMLVTVATSLVFDTPMQITLKYLMIMTLN